MARKLYVGNLPYDTGEQDLQSLFGQAGTVESVNVMRDMATGRARGFAFVEMASDEDAQKAISQLNNYSLGGRNLTVNEARPKTGGGGGGGFGGGGGAGAFSGGGGGSSFVAPEGTDVTSSVDSPDDGRVRITYDPRTDACPEPPVPPGPGPGPDGEGPGAAVAVVAEVRFTG
jgi:cold-inducible RNA-binding protein